MPTQTRKTKVATAVITEPPVEKEETATQRGKRLAAEMDDLLDHIDEVLEDNAEEFVRAYVQKGGQ